MVNQKLLTMLSDLIRINSVNPAYKNGVGEAEIQKFVRSFFSAHDIAVFEQKVLPGRPNIIAKLAGKNDSNCIVFEAHCDTAGVEGMIEPPFDPRIRDGKLYGRGSCDTKAGLAAMMLALADLKHSSQGPASNVWVVSAVDEEHSFRGVWELRKNLLAGAAIISEPTDLKLAIASKGCLRWRITVRGKAAHSSKPWLGVNAIEQMAHVVTCFADESTRLKHFHHPLLGTPTLNVGLIQGGTQVNVVPDSCWIEIDRRLIPGEEPDSVFADYKELFNRRRLEFPNLDLMMEPPQIKDHPLETPASSPIVSCVTRALNGAGLDDHPIGVPFGSDASKLSSVGIPSVILGPGSIDQAHTADEFVLLEQVEKAFEVYREIMSSWG